MGEFDVDALQAEVEDLERMLGENPALELIGLEREIQSLQVQWYQLKASIRTAKLMGDTQREEALFETAKRLSEAIKAQIQERDRLRAMLNGSGGNS